ncbi:MAG: hypothetical protein ACT6U0_01765 [Shinella sp.]|uniref:hypothetical protein n=1 Tax=Shinella sp. TaxID=1870904 RepID=UPI004035DBCE
MSNSYFQKFTIAAGIILLSSAWSARAIDACQKIQFSTERANLSRLLSSSGFSKEENLFLLRGVDQKLSEIKRGLLNARGSECGLNAVRALVIGCLNHSLPSTLRSITSPNRKTGKALWGKSDVTRRDAAVIGMTHACKASAMEHFFSN